LDCGSPLREEVTLGVSFKPMDTFKSPDAVKSDIRKWLARIGVKNNDIVITKNIDAAHVEYVLLGKRYELQSHLQKSFTNNLAAIEQLIHYRVLGMERGIETVEQAFAAYVALPPPPVAGSGYDGLSVAELRKLLFLYHPDQGSEPDTNKFAAVKSALDRKGGAQ
jgi:hypothetical protein